MHGSLGTLTDDCDGNELILKAIAEVKYAKQQFFVVPAGLRRSVEDETSDDDFFLLFFNLDTQFLVDRSLKTEESIPCY